MRLQPVGTTYTHNTVRLSCGFRHGSELRFMITIRVIDRVSPVSPLTPNPKFQFGLGLGVRLGLG